MSDATDVALDSLGKRSRSEALAFDKAANSLDSRGGDTQ